MNREGWLSEETVSDFIERELKTLPFGNEIFAQLHMKKFRNYRRLVLARNEQCRLPDKNYEFNAPMVEGMKKQRHGENQAVRVKRKGCRSNLGAQTGRLKKLEKKCELRRDQEVGVSQGLTDLEKNPAETRVEAFRKQKEHENTEASCNYNEYRYDFIIDKLKDSVFEHLAAEDPSKIINPELKYRIEQRLELFKNPNIPTHLPYASMIQKAILEMNQEGWLNEESISAFIDKYKISPFGQEIFSLFCSKKLCEYRHGLQDENCDKWHTEISREVSYTEVANAGLNQQIVPYSQGLPSSTMLEPHDEQTTISRRDLEERAVDNQEEGEVPVVEEGKQLQITVSSEQKFIICGLPAQQGHRHRVQQLPKIERRGRLPLKKNTAESSKADSVHQNEQQPPKIERRGRRRKQKQVENTSTTNQLLTTSQGCDEPQKQSESESNKGHPKLNLVTLDDQNHNKQQQVQTEKEVGPRRSIRLQTLLDSA